MYESANNIRIDTEQFSDELPDKDTIYEVTGYTKNGAIVEKFQAVEGKLSSEFYSIYIGVEPFQHGGETLQVPPIPVFFHANSIGAAYRRAAELAEDLPEKITDHIKHMHACTPKIYTPEPGEGFN